MTDHSFDAAANGARAGGARPPGPFIGEALRMVSAMQDWAHASAQRAAEQPNAGHTGNDCQWCPLCQFLAVVRGQRPDVADRLAEAGAAIGAALRALVETTSGSAGEGRNARQPPGPRVQKINLGDET